MRYFIYLAYNGAAYSGWQNQPNAPTVQNCIETAMSTILRKPCTIVGAGRTDALVHARQMVAHTDLDLSVDEVAVLADRLNKLLPSDIVIHQIVPVTAQAHARFDALSRCYRYYITEQKDPFAGSISLKIYRKLDYGLMNEAAQTLLEYSDFTSFSKLHTDAKTNICRVTEAYWKQSSAHAWVFTIRADRFLRNMVRAIVGTLFDVGRGKISVEQFRSLIESKDRSQAASSAPGHALFLEEVLYPPELFVVDSCSKAFSISHE